MVKKYRVTKRSYGFTYPPHEHEVGDIVTLPDNVKPPYFFEPIKEKAGQPEVAFEGEKPLTEYTVKELVQYAADNSIDLNGASKKKHIIDAIEKAGQPEVDPEDPADEADVDPEEEPEDEPEEKASDEDDKTGEDPFNE